MKEIKTDIIVAGGGLAGVCAAIAAAREGKTVALIQNRGVLGGNSSSEIRVWVCGATKHGVNRYARETGIMGELFLENQYRNPQGNVYHWDLLLLEKVKKEQNIQLFLNTEVTDVQMHSENRIAAVIAQTQAAENSYRFSAEYVIDCTGDGLVGAKAGAAFHMGRESQAEYGESLAPAEADQDLLGSTLLFYTKDVGEPVKFIAPPFAKKLTDTSILNNRTLKAADNGCAYWWIEWGGKLDTIHDNEAIRDELLAVVYGIWDHIKNSGEYDAATLDLEWVGTLPGKRESRRFIGDYVLTQQDIENQTLFEDRVAFGGWSIDLHPSTGMYTESAGARHVVADGVYHLPYRMLYSKNIDNLFFAGRNVSASHVAFGTIRVMATCGILGEAAGTAAAFAIEQECSPREIYQTHLAAYQQRLLKNDASVIGLVNQDADDLVKQATVSVSSQLTRLDTSTNQLTKRALTQGVGLIFPYAGQKELRVLLEAQVATDLQVAFYETGRQENYIPENLLEATTLSVQGGGRQWVTIPLPQGPARNIFMEFKENPELAVFFSSKVLPGVLTFINDPIAELNQPELHDYVRKSAILYWTNQKINRQNLVFQTAAGTCYQGGALINGLVRPYGMPNLWVSEESSKEETITLNWEEAKTVSEIRLTFNDDVNEDIVNLHHHRTNFEVVPELIKAYEIWGEYQGARQLLVKETDNRVRHLVHDLNPQPFDKLVVNLLETNGSPVKSMYEIRVY